jgi:hypothetical protein
MNKVIIVIFCDEGFGDQYASFVTAYNVIPKIKNLGFDIKIFISKEHKYFSLKTPLSVIYNLSIFDCEVEELRWGSIKEKLKDYKLISFSAIQIYVKNNEDILKDFCYDNITRYNLHNLTENPLLIENFYNNEIIDISNNFISNKNKLAVLHFRSGDAFWRSSLEDVKKDGFWGNQFEKSYNFIESHKDYDVMICSSNRQVVDHFCEKYSNAFKNEFSDNSLNMHRLYGHDFNEDDRRYIEHSKEILGEMISISHAQKAYSINHFSSNFILYGILNNINYSIFRDKIINLI